MDTVSVLVAYHSVNWIRVAIESYLEHFPEERLLVVNNNPNCRDSEWYPHCEEERDWLAAHPGVLLVDNPRLPGHLAPDGRLEHGSGMDVALAWCREHGVRVMVHLEPDCLIAGRQWRDNLLRPLERGAWMTGSLRQRHGPIHPTPSAWLVEEVRGSFRTGSWSEEEEDQRFAELMNLAALDDDLSPSARWIRLNRFWDTGHAAWFHCARRDRALLVQSPDFRHYWLGSVAQRFSERTLAEQFPELRPYLERGRQRKRSLPVEECLYREPINGQADPETACCHLLQQLSGVKDPSWCMVHRNACVACCASRRPSPEHINPVIASLLYGLAESVIDRGGVPGCTKASALELHRQAERYVNVELL